MSMHVLLVTVCLAICCQATVGGTVVGAVGLLDAARSAGEGRRGVPAAPALATATGGTPHLWPLPSSVNATGTLLFLHHKFHFKVPGYGSGVLERALSR